MEDVLTPLTLWLIRLPAASACWSSRDNLEQLPERLKFSHFLAFQFGPNPFELSYRRWLGKTAFLIYFIMCPDLYQENLILLSPAAFDKIKDDAEIISNTTRP